MLFSNPADRQTDRQTQAKHSLLRLAEVMTRGIYHTMNGNLSDTHTTQAY